MFEKFYYIDSLGIHLSSEKKETPETTFTSQEVKQLTQERKTSGIRGVYNKIKESLKRIIKGEKTNEGDSRS